MVCVGKDLGRPGSLALLHGQGHHSPDWSQDKKRHYLFTTVSFSPKQMYSCSLLILSCQGQFNLVFTGQSVNWALLCRVFSSLPLIHSADFFVVHPALCTSSVQRKVITRNSTNQFHSKKEGKNTDSGDKEENVEVLSWVAVYFITNLIGIPSNYSSTCQVCVSYMKFCILNTRYKY